MFLGNKLAIRRLLSNAASVEMSIYAQRRDKFLYRNRRQACWLAPSIKPAIIIIIAILRFFYALVSWRIF